MTRLTQASTGDTVRDLLIEPGDLNAGQLASKPGITVQARRRHLRSLADDGMVDSMQARLLETTPKPLLDQQTEQRAADCRTQLGDVPLAERPEKLVALRRSEGCVTICSRDADETVPDCSFESVDWRPEGGHSSGFRITSLEP